MGKKRIVFIDYIRAIAPLMVMLVHASENFYAADSPEPGINVSELANESNRFWVAFYDGGISRTCVPLFMVVSAFLLVPMKPGMSMSQFYKRRFKRILPPFIVFMLLYSFLPLLWGGMTWEQSLDYLKLLPFNFPPTAGHLWFMYPLISLYLIIPVISPWLEKASAKDEKIFIGLFAFTTLMPWIHRYIYKEVWGECFWNGFHAFWYVSGYLGYLVLAHYIHHHLHWDCAKRLKIGAACFIIGSAFTAWSFWHTGVPGKIIETPMLEWAWEFCTPNVLLATFGAFVMFSCISQEKAPKIITQLSKLSYGVYLMHMFFLGAIAQWFINGNQADPRIPVYLAIPCIAILTYICCAITSKLISYLPGSKYIIG